MKREAWAPLSALAMPNGWDIAELWLLMHDSLVYEEDDRLVLFSGIDPAWFVAEQPWEVAGLPTWYGTFSCRWQYDGLIGEVCQAELCLSGTARPPRGWTLVLPPALHHAEIRTTTPEAPASVIGQGRYHFATETDRLRITWS